MQLNTPCCNYGILCKTHGKTGLSINCFAAIHLPAPRRASIKPNNLVE